GWELVVQQRHTAAGGWETDFVSSAPNGAPQALYDSEGELRWQAPKATLWGQRTVAKTESADPELAFAGQLRDSESGLCYNRFRYYDPAGGGYISPDPIGIAGGESNYGYVHNPKTWIDPLGLTSCQLSSAMEKSGVPRPADSAAHHIVGETSKAAKPARDILNKHGIDVNGAENGVFLPNKNNSDGLSGILHNGRHPDDYLSAVNHRIEQADILGGKQEVIRELGRIRDILSSAQRNASWYTIL
ncbi:RHS repeat-associated core domain-containing protein, partial [Lonsdalea quercina]|uniref:RHS repeat-associated core domain-containing protein n=1 Tax=Lonsdalea quercina TaxID=71657 RepID=UPI00190F8FFB